MTQFNIEQPTTDKGYCRDANVRIGKVEGVSSSYGPGGFGIGLASDRSDGFLYGLASVISAVHIPNTQPLITFAKEGDKFVIDGLTFTLKVGSLGRLTLERV